MFPSLRRSKDYEGHSNFNAILTPLTFLVAYFNSGVNPLLYAFLSRNFRNGVQEVFQCVFKKANKKKGASFHRNAAPVSSGAGEGLTCVMCEVLCKAMVGNSEGYYSSLHTTELLSRVKGDKQS